jgi:hypothetical protein
MSSVYIVNESLDLTSSIFDRHLKNLNLFAYHVISLIVNVTEHTAICTDVVVTSVFDDPYLMIQRVTCLEKLSSASVQTSVEQNSYYKTQRLIIVSSNT